MMLEVLENLLKIEENCIQSCMGHFAQIFCPSSTKIAPVHTAQHISYLSGNMYEYRQNSIHPEKVKQVLNSMESRSRH
jgi:hypothetical protein